MADGQTESSPLFNQLSDLQEPWRGQYANRQHPNNSLISYNQEKQHAEGDVSDINLLKPKTYIMYHQL